MWEDYRFTQEAFGKAAAGIMYMMYIHKLDDF